MSTAYLQYSRKTAAILVVLAMVLALFPMAAFAADNPFSDVSGTLADEIINAYNAGLVSGYEDGTFRPNSNVTRDQFAKMIVLALEKSSGQALPTGSEPFSDVVPSQATYQYVVKAYNAKLINGYPDGTFGYNKPINRQEAAAILQRALKLADAAESFADVPDNSPFAKAIGAVAAAGIMNGYNSTTFGPGDNITRGQAAATAYRAYDYAQPFKVASITLVNARQLKITFTKPVDSKTVIASDKTLVDNVFEFKTLGDKAVTANSATAELSSDGKVLTVTPSGSEYFDGRYAVTIANSVKSTSGDALPAYSAVLDLSDSIRPTVTGITVDITGKVTVTFSEPVLGATNQDAYTVTLNGASVADTNHAYVDNSGNTKATFTISGAQAGKTYTVTINGYVTDYAGNLISPNPTVLTVSMPTDTTKPSITNVEALDLNTIRITFSEPIDQDATDSPLNVSIDGGTAAALASVTWNSDGTQATGDLATNQNPGVHLVKVSGYKDLAGLAGDDYSKFVSFAADDVAPTVKSTTVSVINGIRYIVVQFSEPITLVAVDLQASYVKDGVLYTGQTIGQAKLSQHDSDGDNVSDAVKIDATGMASPAEWTITIPAGLVKDKSDSQNPNEATDVKVSLGSSSDTVAPEVNSVAVQSSNNSVVEVTFSESVTNDTALNTANYTVEGRAVFTSAVFTNPEKTIVRLTLAEGAITATGPAVLEIKNVKDTAGNVMKPYAKTYTFKENVRPKLVSAVLVNVNQVKLTFSEDITDLTANEFENISVAGDTSASVSNVQIDKNVATVTFSKSVSKSGDVIKAGIKAGSYKDAEGNFNSAETFEAKLP
ncbi:hypothetical protein DYI95_002995 [Thermaerobacter sp. PB12/4term]|uniref:S-layer homology domain-containing protein n=1 Tax=Thermaerobacter sp. PB12/4term TaxID=2293838 RepID=UPI001314E938|nr:S-layer homology domain-containing protein [Thermaerobacter sp. PB12/4term]QIA26633.1 hypothetical protein DYI95_002995 [Thermaerobacter sp. PB12/4term]